MTTVNATTSFSPKDVGATLDKAKKLVRAASSSSGCASSETLDSMIRDIGKMEQELNGALNSVKPNIKTKTPAKVYAWMMKAAESVGKLFTKKTGGGKNLASAVTSVILWGNVLKELVGTALYTFQAMTNEDLPKDKRRFVGAYDLGVGVTSTLISFILGVGVQDYIKAGYKSLLKGAKGSPKYGAVLEGLSAFTSFGLQTIVGKRILAPLVGVPVATKIRKFMEDRDAKKNGTTSENVQGQPPKTHVEYPTNRHGYVDLQEFVARVHNEQENKSD